MTTPPGRVDPLRFGVSCLLVYVLLSWAVRFDMRRGTQIASLVYPLDTFSMYSNLPDERVGHLLVRDSNGAVHAIDAFSVYDCDGKLHGIASPCVDGDLIEYHFDDLVAYIDEHRGSAATDVELIVRRWQITAGDAPRVIGDCVVRRCRVTP